MFFFFTFGQKKFSGGGSRKTRKGEKFEKKKFSIFGSKMTLLVEKLPRMNLVRGFMWFLIIFGHVFFSRLFLTIFDHCLVMFAGLSFFSFWMDPASCSASHAADNR